MIESVQDVAYALRWVFGIPFAIIVLGLAWESWFVIRPRRRRG